MDYITLSDGTSVHYSYSLVREGIIAHAFGGDLTPEQKQEFEKKLRSERDLVRLFWKDQI